MLRGARRELCREPRAAEVVDFVSVYLRVEAHLLRGLEQPAALVYGEYALLAEDVAELRYALFLDLRQHLLDEHFVDELVGAALVFLRNGVRAHEGRHYVERRFASYTAYNFEHFQLEAELEAVAALYLDGGRSLRESGERKLFRRLEKLLLRRGLYGVDRGEYAAAARKYLKVGKSREAHPELVSRRFAKHMCVCGSTKPGMTQAPPKSFSVAISQGQTFLRISSLRLFSR